MTVNGVRDCEYMYMTWRRLLLFYNVFMDCHGVVSLNVHEFLIDQHIYLP